MVQEIREMIRTVYGKYDVWLRALGKFSLAFGSLLVIRNFMGYLPLLDNILILLILALVASFLPLNGMVLICFVVILGELYGLSLPSLAVGGGLLLLVALLYFGLAPQGALAFLLTPLALVLHVPLAVPVAFGLLETPLSAIGIAAGTVSYYGLKSVIGTEFVLSDPSLSMQEAFIEEMQAMLSNSSWKRRDDPDTDCPDGCTDCGLCRSEYGDALCLAGGNRNRYFHLSGSGDFRSLHSRYPGFHTGSGHRRHRGGSGGKRFAAFLF